MRHRAVSPGEIIFHEGDPSGNAYVVRSGRVDIVKESANGPIILAHLEENDIFGEISLVDEQPRPATARAVDEVRLQTETLDDFMDMLAHRPEDTFRYLRSLFQRIRALNAGLAVQVDPGGPGYSTDCVNAKVLVLPRSPAAALAVPAEGLAPRRFPLRVGRAPSAAEAQDPDTNDLRLPDTEPFNVSRDHFSICAGGDYVCLKDMGSYLGTIVNGVVVGGNRTVAEIELTRGENEVIVGGKHSPFRFAVVVALESTAGVKQ